MKKLLLSLALAVLTCGTSQAQQPEAAAPATGTAAVSVGTELQKLQFMNEVRPAADAKFYIYLCSASWCPPCRRSMPGIVAEYPNIKAAGGEIILLCFDRTAQAGAGYLKNYKIPFAASMAGFETVGSLNLPGFIAPKGIPNIVIVSAKGELLFRGHGALLVKWAQLLEGKI